MNFKEKINLMDANDKALNTHLLLDDDSASLTHYLHNRVTDFSTIYKPTAVKVVHHILKLQQKVFLPI